MTLREAAQQALEAIDRALPHAPYRGEFDALADMADALRAELSTCKKDLQVDLRAALAKPKEKPWRCACGANLYIDENGAPRSKV